ncbi:DUF4440 domain-containing protein [Mycetocola zhujimingii]|uniref:nuclear transport factor 2 family protein n=1 Tax=Mycetocola zhujimingii TaxID=2079792 RepID=UPI000D36901E|nr:nuclear transport factor 2 family protein [Mycetocola zhujimingii]AWB87366.1 nuclear transport factor 2 family protein [Mycetocola zhujimingii]
MDTYSAIRDAELALLSPAVRGDADRLRALLHPEFVEIGRSGRRWTREEILGALVNEESSETPPVDDWQFTDLADGLTLVTYLIRGDERDSRHSSLWDTSTGAPVMRFHQGTVVAGR